MAVTRTPGLVRIALTVMPGHAAAAIGEGETCEITFPQPVPVTGGEWADIVITWASGQPADYAGPVWMPCAQVIGAAHVQR